MIKRGDMIMRKGNWRTNNQIPYGEIEILLDWTDSGTYGSVLFSSGKILSYKTDFILGVWEKLENK